LRFTDVKAVAIRNFTRNFVHAAGSSTRKFIAAVCAFSVNFKFAGAIARTRAEIRIVNTKHKFSTEVTQQTFLEILVTAIDDAWAKPFQLKRFLPITDALLDGPVVSQTGVFYDEVGITFVNCT
jgi:hypothetical protein